MAFSKLLRAVTLTNLRHEFEYLDSIKSGLPICSFFVGLNIMVLKEEIMENINVINCFFFGSTKHLSKELDSNIFLFFSECLLNGYNLSGVSVGDAYGDCYIVLIGIGIRIPFFFKRKQSRLKNIFSIEMEIGMEEGVLGLLVPHIFINEVKNENPFFFFSSSVGFPSFFFYNKSISLESESKCFFFPSLPFFFRFINNFYFDPVFFSYFFDFISKKMNTLFFFESFLLSFSLFFSIATVNTKLCEEFIYLFYYEKKLLKYEALADLFFRLYARQRHSEVTTEMLDVFISIYSIELRG